MNNIPFLVGVSCVLLAFVALVTALASRVNTNKLSHILGVSVPWIILVGVTVIVQFHLHELRPDLFNLDSDDGGLAFADVLVGIFSIYRAYDFIDDL